MRLFNNRSKDMCVHVMYMFYGLWQGERLLWSSVWRIHQWGFWGFHWRHRWELRAEQSSFQHVSDHPESPGCWSFAGLFHRCEIPLTVYDYYFLTNQQSLLGHKPRPFSGIPVVFLILWCRSLVLLIQKPSPVRSWWKATLTRSQGWPRYE